MLLHPVSGYGAHVTSQETTMERYRSGFATNLATDSFGPPRGRCFRKGRPP